MKGYERIRRFLISAFEADLENRVHRASGVQLQKVIPSHWFAAAASECAGMYVSGFFYGCISISQAYVEALSKFLCEHHRIKLAKDVELRWRRLSDKKLVSSSTLDAALAIFSNRNDFHHLNKNVELDFTELQKRAEQCVMFLHAIESEIFAFSYSGSEAGKIVLGKPEYWPSPQAGIAAICVRDLW